VRSAEYAGCPGSAVGRDVSTNSSWRTVTPNGRVSTAAGADVVVDCSPPAGS